MHDAEGLDPVAIEEHLAALAGGGRQATRALPGLERQLQEVIRRRRAAIAACVTCQALPASCYALSSATRPGRLPPQAYAILPRWVGDLQVDRKHALLRCRRCETPYRYDTDYEFLVGGSEDAEELRRLAVDEWFARARSEAVRRARSVQRETARSLRLALELEDLTPAAAARRKALREAVAEVRAALEAERPADEPLAELAARAAPVEASQAARVAGCTACRHLPDRVEPRPEEAHLVHGVSSGGRPEPGGVVRCARCRLPYLWERRDVEGTLRPAAVRLTAAPLLARLREALLDREQGERLLELFEVGLDLAPMTAGGSLPPA